MAKTTFILAAYLLQLHFLQLFFFISIFDRNTIPLYVYFILDARALDSSFFIFLVLGNSLTIVWHLSELLESWDYLHNPRKLILSG
jgi:hypothetical protein